MGSSILRHPSFHKHYPGFGIPTDNANRSERGGDCHSHSVQSHAFSGLESDDDCQTEGGGEGSV